MSDKQKAHKALTNKPGEAPRHSAYQNFNQGSVYVGTVTQVDTLNGMCTVLTKNPGKELKNVIWAAGGIMAPLLGFKTRALPPIGSKVAVLYGEPSFVLQVIPTEPTDHLKSNKKSNSGESYRADKEVYGDGRTAGPVVDADALEGEYDISNAMDVGLLFLNNMMSIKAGERAKVETHLLNDMVRIISEVYRHHSSFGDFEIYNDGRLNVEWHGTSYEHESYNKSDSKSPKVPTKNGEVAYDQIEDGSLFKQRFSQYIGYLGDFVHLFLREPQETATSIITGKARVQLMNGGTVLVSSTDEIILERTCRVVVPRRLVEHDDDRGVTYMDYVEKNLPQEPLREWDFGPGNKNIHHVAYQLREYARYVSYTKSLARFHQAQDKDFDVPTEADTPAPSISNKEQDRAEANGTVPFYETYSTIRMLRGGGIVLVAGDGSSLNLGNQQAVLSSVDKIVLDAAGDIVMTAGGGIYATAYKDVHLAAVTGGIMQKARTKFHVLCERGLLWLKSDAGEGNSETGDKGVYVDAAAGSVVINGKKNVCIRAETEDVALKAKEGTIIFKANKNLTLMCESGVLFLQSMGTGLLAQCKKFQLMSNKAMINDDITINTSTVDCNLRVKLRDKLTVEGNIYGPPKVEKLYGSKRHSGHIRVSGAPLPPATVDTSLSDQAGKLTADASKSDKVVDGLDGSVWKFDSKEFPSQPADGTSASIYRPISQDYLATHADLFSSSHTDWNFEQDNKLKAGPRTEVTLPYPGQKNTMEMAHPDEAGKVMDKPSDSKEFTQTELVATSIKKKRKK